MGFRFTAVRVSDAFDVVGTVRNLPDGRVELVAEGEVEELDRFMAAIDVQMGRLINEAACTESAATGRYSTFDIAF